MRKLLLITLAIAFCLFASPAAAQVERLAGTDYDTALAKALDAASSRDRRVLTEETFYTATQVTGTRKIVSEFAGPDARKIEVTEEFNGKKSRSDSVRIGTQFFCRDGDKGWKQADKECVKGGKTIAIP